MDRLSEIEQRANAATPGPWKRVVDEDCDEWQVWDASGNWQLATCHDDDETFTFMVEAREDIPWLIAEVKRLRAELAEPSLSKKLTEAK